MTSQLKAKLLQHFAGKKQANGGFTLIELLVVIIIIGILSAIALPSFLNQANKARASEAKTYVGSMNRGQQAYYLENGNFAFNGAPNIASAPLAFSALGLGIAQETDNYLYAIVDQSAGAGTTAVAATASPSDGTGSATVDANAAVKSYQGTVKVGVTTAGGDATTLAILCEALQPPVAGGDDSVTPSTAGLPAATIGAPTCGANFKTIQ